MPANGRLDLIQRLKG